MRTRELAKSTITLIAVPASLTIKRTEHGHAQNGELKRLANANVALIALQYIVFERSKANQVEPFTADVYSLEYFDNLPGAGKHFNKHVQQEAKLKALQEQVQREKAQRGKSQGEQGKAPARAIEAGESSSMYQT